VSDVQDIWVGQNGEKLGPFTELAVRTGMAKGNFAADALGWRTGMPGWAPLASMMHAYAPPAPPPQPNQSKATVLRAERPIAPQPQQRYYHRGASRAEVTLPEPASTMPPGLHYYAEPSFSPSQARPSGSYGNTAARSALPMPPTMHWGLLAMFSFFTLGLFGLFWRFVQATWVRKIDVKSKAPLLFGIGLALYVAFILTAGVGGPVSDADLPMAAALMLLHIALALAGVIVFLIAYFSMAASIRRVVRAHGETFDTSDFVLFFFNMYYIQGQLTWIGHWKQTGQTEPQPPKGILWILSIAPFLLIAVLAAIAIPIYQNKLVRAEGMESVSISADARIHVANFYNRYKRYPRDNAEAMLLAGTKINGKYVSQVEVDHGKVTVYYDSVKASTQLIGKHIVFMPVPNGTQMTWECKSESDVDPEYLPKTCQ
jgi:Pilin (bacterial filament)/GYF domain 2